MERRDHFFKMARRSEEWLADLDAAEQLGQEIMELINERNSLERSGTTTARASALIRSKLQTFSKNIKMLQDSLKRETTLFTTKEGERRQTQIDSLVSKEKQLNQAFKPSSMMDNMERNREGLLNVGFESDHNRGGNSSHNDDLTHEGFQQRQQQIIAEQDSGLDALSSIIQRQKLMGRAIGEEIDYQNDLIDDITEGVDRTKDKLIRTETHVKKVNKKSGSCALLVTVVLLFVVIIALVAIPN